MADDFGVDLLREFGEVRRHAWAEVTNLFDQSLGSSRHGTFERLQDLDQPVDFDGVVDDRRTVEYDEKI